MLTKALILFYKEVNIMAKRGNGERHNLLQRKAKQMGWSIHSRKKSRWKIKS